MPGYQRVRKMESDRDSIELDLIADPDIDAVYNPVRLSL